MAHSCKARGCDAKGVTATGFCERCFLQRKLRDKLRGCLGLARWRVREASEKGKHVVPFGIDLAFLERLYEAQGGLCALTNRPFNLVDPPPNRCQAHPHAISIDQIVPGGGYTPANVRLVHKTVNDLLGQYGDDCALATSRALLEAHGFFVTTDMANTEVQRQ